MLEQTTLYVQRCPGEARWRAEVPIAGIETRTLVGWPTIEQYYALFGWHPRVFKPVCCCHLTPQQLVFTVVQVVFVRVVPARPAGEGIAWPHATPPGGADAYPVDSQMV